MNLSDFNLWALNVLNRADIISTLQFLGLIRYVKGQHVISATPKLLEQHTEQLARGSRPSSLVAASSPTSAGGSSAGDGKEAKGAAPMDTSSLNSSSSSSSASASSSHDKRSGYAVFDPSKLKWTPPVFGNKKAKLR